MNRLIRHRGKEHWAQFEREMKGTHWYFFNKEESSISNSNRFYKLKHGLLFSPIMRSTMKITQLTLEIQVAKSLWKQRV